MNKAERQKHYKQHLLDNGYQCRIDEFDDIEFLRVDPQTDEVRKMCIILTDFEPYLNVAFPIFAKVPSVEGASKVAEMLCGVVNQQCGVVKWYILPDGTMWAAAQIFVPTSEVGCQMLRFCLESIEASFNIIRRVPQTREILDHLIADSDFS